MTRLRGIYIPEGGDYDSCRSAGQVSLHSVERTGRMLVSEQNWSKSALLVISNSCLMRLSHSQALAL